MNQVGKLPDGLFVLTSFFAGTTHFLKISKFITGK